MKLRLFEVFDYILFFPVLILITIGVCFIYSSGFNSSGVNVSNEYVKQLIFAGTGLILLIAFSFIDYRKVKPFAQYLYIGLILLLIYTRIFGSKVNGARSWIGFGGIGIQPSEFGKVFFILFFAKQLEKTEAMEPFKRFVVLCIFLAIPTGLILLQPDLGTASVYIPVFLGMCFVAGIPLRYIMVVLCTGLLTIFFTVLPVYQTEIAQRTIQIISILTNMRLRLIVIVCFGIIMLLSITANIFLKQKYFYWIAYVSGIILCALMLSIAAGKVLQDYQIKRLIVFIDPESDPLGSGWNIIQSKIAIGSGNLFGQGYLKGTQSHFRFLPQQSTDFIFSILSEEWGFIGGFIVFALYFIILLRIIFILKNTTNTYGYYIATGILFMFFFHFMVNVGMVMGLMPITGIPLLFLSYGGSSLWTSMICIGILMSIHNRRLDF